MISKVTKTILKSLIILFFAAFIGYFALYLFATMMFSPSPKTKFIRWQYEQNARANATAYICEKYGFTPDITEIALDYGYIDTWIDSIDAKPSGEAFVTFTVDGKDYKAYVGCDRKATKNLDEILTYDNYQFDTIVQDMQEYFENVTGIRAELFLTDIKSSDYLNDHYLYGMIHEHYTDITQLPDFLRDYNVIINVGCIDEDLSRFQINDYPKLKDIRSLYIASFKSCEDLDQFDSKEADRLESDSIDSLFEDMDSYKSMINGVYRYRNGYPDPTEEYRSSNSS